MSKNARGNLSYSLGSCISLQNSITADYTVLTLGRNRLRVGFLLSRGHRNFEKEIYSAGILICQPGVHYF